VSVSPGAAPGAAHPARGDSARELQAAPRPRAERLWRAAVNLARR